MSLRDVMAHDVSTVFLNADDFAITIGYTPSGASLIEISAVLEDPLEDQLNMMGASSLGYQKKFLNVSESNVPTPVIIGTNGRSPDMVNLPGDMKNWYVLHVVSSDGYMHRLMIVDNLSAALRR